VKSDVFKAFVIQLDNPAKDLSDVVQIARSVARDVFRTKEVVRVVRIYGPDPLFGYVAVVENPKESKS
jgi:hypothetical protein